MWEVMPNHVHGINIINESVGAGFIPAQYELNSNQGRDKPYPYNNGWDSPSKNAR